MEFKYDLTLKNILPDGLRRVVYIAGEIIKKIYVIARLLLISNNTPYIDDLPR